MRAIQLQRGRQRGFTLIELISVIVILGALAATALPKFMDLRTDAVIASMRGLEAAIHSTKNLMRAKCVLTAGCNLSSGSSLINVDGVVLGMYHGWPDAGDTINNNELDRLITASGFTVSLWNSGAPGNATRWTPTAAKTPASCYVQYQEAQVAGADPSVTVVTSGC